MRPAPLLRALAASAILVATAAAAQTPEAWPTREWEASTPAAEGLDTAVLANLVDYLATPSFNTDSVLVVRHGRIVLEAYAEPVHAGLRHDLRSVTKSVLSTLVGEAIQEGRIASVDRPVLAFFPEQQASGERQQALTVRHLLDMTPGFAWREWPYDANSDGAKLWAAPDWTRFILARAFASEPGTKFLYNAAAPHLLSVVLTRSTGQNAADYARGHLFRTLGIVSFTWPSDPQGNSIGESALMLTPRDMARIGLLHMRKGVWEGQQLLPAGWTDAIFEQPGVPHTLSNSPPTYRNLWWTDASVPYAAAIGRHGQFIILLPRQDLMLVVTSKTADASYGATSPALVQRYLLPAVVGKAPRRHELHRCRATVGSAGQVQESEGISVAITKRRGLGACGPCVRAGAQSVELHRVRPGSVGGAAALLAHAVGRERRVRPDAPRRDDGPGRSLRGLEPHGRQGLGPSRSLDGRKHLPHRDPESGVRHRGRMDGPLPGRRQARAPVHGRRWRRAGDARPCQVGGSGKWLLLADSVEKLAGAHELVSSRRAARVG